MEMLRDAYASNDDWRFFSLRYFNPVDAHASGLIGEDPQGVPNNLLPFVAQVAVGRREFLNVWGIDYAMPDGTGVHDYIHVVDLAQGHLWALELLHQGGAGQCQVLNLGTGMGHSVLDTVKAFEAASGKRVPYRIEARRAGDTAACYADPTLAQNLLKWSAQRTLQSMCDDTWSLQLFNPAGYATQD
jgi:UDP-glucose 4-epimerase